MFKYISYILLFLSSAFVYADTLTVTQPPQAKKVVQEFSQHEDKRSDDYYWLRDANNPEVIAYLTAWNDYTDYVMQPTEKLQSILHQEMLARLEDESLSPFFYSGPYTYFTRQLKNQNYPTLYRKRIDVEGKEEILLDENKMAKRFDYFKLHHWSPSPDGTFVAYAIDLQGTEFCSIYVQDTLSEQMMPPEVIPNTNKNIIWSENSRGFWYLAVDGNFRNHKIKFHEIGTSPANDRTIYEEPNTLYDLYLSESQDKRFIFINSRSTTTSEAFYFSKDDSSSSLQLIASKIANRLYFPESFQNEFFIRVKDGPNNYGIVKTPISNPSSDNWKPFIPSSNMSQITDMHLFKNHLVISKIEKGFIQIEIHHLNSGKISQVPFPDLLYCAYVLDDQDFDSTELKIGYSSPVKPHTIFSYKMDTQAISTLMETKIPGFDSSLYNTEQIEAVAKDGKVIPISLIYRKDLCRDTPAPVVLYAYGAYELSCNETFFDPDFTLINRGVIYAIAHVRGGGEFGRPWYEQGRVLNKKNSFTDFIACAEHLINQGITSSSKLVIEGKSAGGLLIGAVLNMRPDLFKAAVAEVPFLDVVTTMSDESIPYVAQEKEEWGDCSKKEDYFYMKSYSPYDNIERKSYPSILVTAGLHDAQVPFWEAAKWAAKLLEYKTDNNPLLLKVNMNAGHQSYSDRSLQLQEMAFKYAFMLQQLGITE